MPLIIPSADLRNNYNKISKRCHETKEPIYVTRNGVNDLVVLSDEVFEKMRKQNEESEEERIDRLVSEKFDKQYKDLEDFKNDLLKNISNANIYKEYEFHYSESKYSSKISLHFHKNMILLLMLKPMKKQSM